MFAFLYSVLIFKYKAAAWIFSFINTKAKKRISGLKIQNSHLDDQLYTVSVNRILVHCASLGEYEQALPVIHWIIDNTQYDIVVSFFSPSGYKNCKLPTERCIKCYLPFDLKSDMESFISNVAPVKVIITKNEWWWNMLSVLKSKSIPTFLISSTIRNTHYFIKNPNPFFKNGLSAFKAIFVLNDASKQLLTKVYTGPVIVSGDSRKDQVLAIKNQSKPKNQTQPTVIYGSAWTHDLPVIKGIIEQLPSYNHYVYPHELSQDNITAFCEALNCEAHNDISSITGTAIIQSMGQLKKDYVSAQIAYIGGGFGDGIHNILEAAVYNIPTIFGHKYHKSEEAQELIDLQVAFSVSDPSQLTKILNNLQTNEYREQIKLKLNGYFCAPKSATEIITSEIFK